MNHTPRTYHELPQRWQAWIKSWAKMSINLDRTLEDTKHDVIRWGDYHRLGLRIPVQTVGDHIHGLDFLMSMVIRWIEDYQSSDRPIDERLLRDCVRHHDMPEIWLHSRRTSQFDVSAPRKSDRNDIAENRAHTEAFQHASRRAQEHYRRAYLLQVVAKNTESNGGLVSRLNAEDRQILNGLKHDRMLEGHIFRAVEVLEYCVYSAFCTMLHPPIYRLAEDVIPVSLIELRQLAEHIPGFNEVVLTPGICAWFDQFKVKEQ